MTREPDELRAAPPRVIDITRLAPVVELHRRQVPHRLHDSGTGLVNREKHYGIDESSPRTPGRSPQDRNGVLHRV